MEDKSTLVKGQVGSSDDIQLTTSYQIEELRGYLLKKTRNGKWQKRWFETNGCFLTYYKKQGQKLLAALNLPQVGDIVALPEDTEDGPGLFSIELNERIYTIKAKNQEEASLWVEALIWRQKGGVVAQSNGDDSLFLHASAHEDDGIDMSPTTTSISIPNKPIEDHPEDLKKPGCTPCCVIQ